MLDSIHSLICKTIYFVKLMRYDSIQYFPGGLRVELIVLLVIIISIIVGFYMAWSIGANDVANSMATAVGAKAITFRQAALIAGVLIFFWCSIRGSSCC
jgi:ABC-type molybdate transport system permease subunit